MVSFARVCICSTGTKIYATRSTIINTKKSKIALIPCMLPHPTNTQQEYKLKQNNSPATGTLFNQSTNKYRPSRKQGAHAEYYKKHRHGATSIPSNLGKHNNRYATDVKEIWLRGMCSCGVRYSKEQYTLHIQKNTPSPRQVSFYSITVRKHNSVPATGTLFNQSTNKYRPSNTRAVHVTYTKEYTHQCQHLSAFSFAF